MSDSRSMVIFVVLTRVCFELNCMWKNCPDNIDKHYEPPLHIFITFPNICTCGWSQLCHRVKRVSDPLTVLQSIIRPHIKTTMHNYWSTYTEQLTLSAMFLECRRKPEFLGGRRGNNPTHSLEGGFLTQVS